MIGNLYTCLAPAQVWGKEPRARVVVRVVCRWGKGGGPRNVQVEQIDGDTFEAVDPPLRWIRPFRGMRRVRS